MITVPYEERLAAAQELERTEHLTIIPPYDDPTIIAGQGTTALELFQEVGVLDTLVVPLGGGGLLSGCALAAKAKNPKCRIIGVEPEAGNDGQQSLRVGKIVSIAPPRTIADGAQTESVGELPFAIIRELVSDIVSVPDFRTYHYARVGGYGDFSSVAEGATYPTLTRPVHTVGVDTLLLGRAGLSDATTRGIAEAFFAALPELGALPMPFRFVDPAQASATPIPLHSGAARYYRERELFR